MEAALKPAAPSAVTVVITSCNQGALIREAVESALAQTIRPDCVIVVDDGSDDPASIAVLDGLAELGAPGRDGTAPAGQFAPVLEKTSLYQFPSCHLQDGTIHLLGARLKMSIAVKPKAVIS